MFINRLPAALNGTTLAQSDIRHRWGILVLMIKSAQGEHRHAGADSIIGKDDIVTVIGQRSDIEKCFNLDTAAEGAAVPEM